MAAIKEALEAARNRAFAATLYTEYLGDPLPLTGATVKMEVRQYGGQEGAALVGDADVTFTDEDTGRTEVDQHDGITKPVRQMVLEPLIPATDMGDPEKLPGLNQPEAGDPHRFEYEIMLIYADTLRDSLWIGDFNVSPGVVA